MITVAHEALIDLIVDPAGHVDPRLGGAGFNVTRAVARLGRPVAFLGRLSGDRFGQLMRADLERHGVRIAVAGPSEAPTTLALVDLDPAGVPSYHFYLDGTSAAAVGPGEAVLPEGTTAAARRQPLPGHGAGRDQHRTHGGQRARRRHGHAGPELPPDGHRLPAGLPGPARPHPAPGGHRQGEHRGSRLHVPRPGPRGAAAELLARGPPACSSPTARPRCGLSPAASRSMLDVPAAPVVDTVGAGDAFGGAFLTWWTRQRPGPVRPGRPEPVRGQPRRPSSPRW